MAELLRPGQKVKYIYAGKEYKGIIHGVKTHEEPSGIITRVAYLIDTGKVVREDVTKVSDKGKVLETTKQPEQIEIDQNFVRLA